MVATPLSLFTTGEVSPLLSGRTDLPAYANALARGTNLLVVPHGPATRRTGTRRAVAAAAGARFTAPFIFDLGDAYVIEFYDFRMRFIRVDGTQVVDGLGVVYELETPWTAAQARQLRWQQSGNLVRFCHRDVPTQDLKRTAANPPETFTLTPSEFKDGPYYPENSEDTTVTAAATGTGPIAVESSEDVFDVSSPSKDIGRLFRAKIATGTDWAWGVITAVADATHATVDFKVAVVSTSATTSWRLGLYSARTGYPAAICIHQERWVLGSNPALSFPRVDLGRSGAIFTLDFTPGTDDDHAIQVVVPADEIPLIRDVKVVGVLVAVTASGNFKVFAAGGTLTPIDRECKDLPSSTGGGDVPALRAQGSLLFLDPQRSSLGEIRAKSEVYADALGYREISIRNEHLFRDSPGVALAYADKPYGLVCVPREDGVLVMGPYLPDQEVVAFTPHQLAGGGMVLSVCTLPTTRGNEIWLLVQRGATVTHEVLTQPLRNTDPDREAVNLDMAVTTRDARNATLTDMGGGLWRASAGVFTGADEGRAIQVLALDGKDALNLPKWKAGILRIDSVDSATDITCTVETSAPASPVAAGDWLVSIDSFPGLEHLEGRVNESRAWVDGAERGPFTVTAGTLPDGVIGPDEDVWVVTVGLWYRSEMQPMPPNPQTGKGSAIGRKVDAVKTRARVLRTTGLRQMRWDGSPSGELPVRKNSPPPGLSLPLYSGDIVLGGSSDGDTPVAPWLVSESAGPFTVTALAPDYVVGETG